MRPCIALSALLLPALAGAQDARTILETMQERQAARAQGVRNYLVDQATMGHRVLLYYERVAERGGDAVMHPGFRLVPPDEIARRQQEERGLALSPEDLRRMGDAAETTGAALGAETERAMEEAGLPPGLLGASPNRFATLDPRVMMGNVGAFYDAAADAQEAAEARDPAAEVRQSQADMARFAATAELLGTEDVYGREAWVIRAEGIDSSQRTGDGEEMTMETATFWIDAQEYVPLRLRMEGTMTSGGETRALTIERHDQDYRQVGGLYLPYRQVMRMAGVLDAAQRAEMEKAQAQLAEFDRQLAAMPEAQRQMAMNMMGPQIEMVRKMASGGGFEVVTDVYGVRVNAGLPDEQAQAEVLFRAMPPTAGPQAEARADATGFAAFSAAGAGTPAASATPGAGAATAAGGAGAGTAPAAMGAAAPEAAAPDEAELRAAQQECLRKKVDEAQAANKKRRGIGRLLGAASRVALRRGDRDFARAVHDVYTADATVADLAAAAEDLGLTEDDVAACRRP